MGILRTYCGGSNPIMEELLFTLRDPTTEMALFDQTLRKIGFFLGYEIAKDLPTKEKTVTTLLDAQATHRVLDVEPVIIGVIRAGVPLMEGIYEAFPRAQRGYVAAARDEKTLKATISYYGVPSLNDKIGIVADPMFATGGSLEDVIAVPYANDEHPSRIIIASVFATNKGIERINKHYPNVDIYTAVIDPILLPNGFISPGCGDAGDRINGVKSTRITLPYQRAS